MGEFPQGESTAGAQDDSEPPGGESAPGDMGEFPQGESTAGTQGCGESTGSEGEPGDLEDSVPDESTAGTQDCAETAGSEDEPGDEDPSGSEAEPGFGDGDSVAADEDALPDLRDEPTLEEAMESVEEAMGEPGGDSAASDSASAGNQGDSAEQGGAAGDTAAGDPATSGVGGDQTAQGGAQGSSADSSTDAPGNQGNNRNDGRNGAGGSGPLTPAEMAAILESQLERGTGEFDDMILDEQAAQRRAAREQMPGSSKTPTSTETGSGEGGSYGGMADAGAYSTGGGMGGTSRPGDNAGMPQNTAKYPAPANIPSGNDDDVLARQLREAAMREPDPEIREKLWDEYRKYKGID